MFVDRGTPATTLLREARPMAESMVGMEVCVAIWAVMANAGEDNKKLVKRLLSVDLVEDLPNPLDISHAAFG